MSNRAMRELLPALPFAAVLALMSWLAAPPSNLDPAAVATTLMAPAASPEDTAINSRPAARPAPSAGAASYGRDCATNPAGNGAAPSLGPAAKALSVSAPAAQPQPDCRTTAGRGLQASTASGALHPASLEAPWQEARFE